MKPAQKIAAWADQLRHLSAMGLHFSKDPYDRQNYELNAKSATANESLERRWFAQDELPPDMDPGHVTRIADAYRIWQGDTRTAYDA